MNWTALAFLGAALFGTILAVGTCVMDSGPEAIGDAVAVVRFLSVVAFPCLCEIAFLSQESYFSKTGTYMLCAMRNGHFRLFLFARVWLWVVFAWPVVEAITFDARNGIVYSVAFCAVGFLIEIIIGRHRKQMKRVETEGLQRWR